MVFSSTVFLFIFLPLVFTLNLIVPGKYRNFILLIFSLFFYAWGEPIYVLIMLFSIWLNYIIAIQISQHQVKARKKFLVAGIIINISILLIFKYTNFFVDNINAAFNISINIKRIPLPIGISFFTFQAMSYIIDIYKEKAKPEHKLLNTALYISAFPQLIAGPIVKYDDIYRQIENREMTAQKIKNGIKRFIIGLSKKVLIANVIGEVADSVFSMNINDTNIIFAWIGAIAYSVQIYFDFSGYSDMAIGLGKMFGFDFKENFNYPYISKSINEFWKRWHISLTNWFREYLYFPLGGNRKGIKRTYINIFIVFLCTGFWHGAEWTFIIWGVYHGLFMILERCKAINPERFKPGILARIYTLVIVVVGFTVFRAENISRAVQLVGKMFAGLQFSPGWQYTLLQMISPLAVIIFAMSIVASTPYIKNLPERLGNLKYKRIYENLGDMVSMLLFLLSILALSTETYNPFIYFRF